uniref:Uncharacterized protein n=1 Tax=Quercus lobata TaxID=97700 RepID=A0A7N2MHX1_QUELO
MGTLAKAFVKHVKDPRVNAEEVQAWKAALKAVGNISGWHRHGNLAIFKEILALYNWLSPKLAKQTFSFDLSCLGYNNLTMHLIT